MQLVRRLSRGYITSCEPAIDLQQVYERDLYNFFWWHSRGGVSPAWRILVAHASRVIQRQLRGYIRQGTVATRLDR